MDRRGSLKLLGAATASLFIRSAWAQGPQQIASGQFAGTRDSLRRYKIPEWLGKSKFGIWAHWGPQSAVGDGDWYARNMYIQGSPQYQYHLDRFGPQSKVGYKDLIHLFTADRWDPDVLMDLYVKAGAKYFFSMGVHHDNFDMWNSKYQPRWNAVAAGPKADDFAGPGIQRSKQTGRAVPRGVMGAALDLPRSHGQQWSGAIQRLDLALFIHAQDQRALRRVHIKSHDVAHFINEQRVF